MKTFEVYRLGGSLYTIVQAQHLLDLNTILVVPVLPAETLPALSKLTVDVMIEDRPYRIRAYQPLTIDAARLRGAKPVHQLTPDQGADIMNGLNTILWGL